MLFATLRWRHNGRDSVSNHQPHDCLLKGLFRRRSKNTSKLRVTGLCVGNSPGPVNSPHKWPVTRKMNKCDDVIMDTWVFQHDSATEKSIVSKRDLARFVFMTSVGWISYIAMKKKIYWPFFMKLNKIELSDKTYFNNCSMSECIIWMSLAIENCVRTETGTGTVEWTANKLGNER